MEQHPFGYQVIRCALRHEEFVNDPSQPCMQQERRGFCPKSFRDKNLCCAHSMGWYQWVNQLKLNGDFFERPQTKAMLLEMEYLRTAIFKLDHRKGELEKQKVLYGQQEATEQLRQLDREYHTIVDQLEAFFHQLTADYQQTQINQFTLFNNIKP